MADKNTSIMQDMAEIQELLKEMRPAPDGHCDDCGSELEYIRGHIGDLYEPPSVSGFYCSECEVFEPN